MPITRGGGGYGPPAVAVAQSSVPSWVSGTAIDAWAEIPGSAAQSGVPLSMAAPNSFGGSAPASARMDAWCGFAMVGRKIYSAAQGGHGDYRGNEVLAFDVDTGLWSLVLASSPPGDFIDGGPYSDGRPAATHGYYTWQPVPQRNWLVSAGQAATANNGGTYKRCTVYDITANAYLTQGTMPDMPVQPIGAEYGVGSDPATGDVYACYSGNLYKWTQSSNTWDQVGGLVNSAGYETVLCTDSTRGRMLILAGQGSQNTANLLTFSTGAMTQPTMSGDSGITSPGGQWGAAYCETTDLIYAMETNAAAAGLYTIHPTTFVVAAKSTSGAGSMPAGVNGVFGRLKKVTYGSAGGLIYFPNHAAAAWFLRLH